MFMTTFRHYWQKKYINWTNPSGSNFQLGHWHAYRDLDACGSPLSGGRSTGVQLTATSVRCNAPLAWSWRVVCNFISLVLIRRVNCSWSCRTNEQGLRTEDQQVAGERPGHIFGPGSWSQLPGIGQAVDFVSCSWLPRPIYAYEFI